MSREFPGRIEIVIRLMGFDLRPNFLPVFGRVFGLFVNLPHTYYHLDVDFSGGITSDGLGLVLSLVRMQRRGARSIRQG